MNVLIVDDEPLARDRLRDLLSGRPDLSVVGEVGDGRAACERAADGDVDVVLLDIAMPVMGGIEAARHMAGFDAPPAVIFCTAYDEHALAAFEARAVDYLVKPIRRERLHEALDRARRLAPEHAEAAAESLGEAIPRSHICARMHGRMRLIPVEEIHFLRAEEKYVVVAHAHGEDLIEESLKSLESEFGDQFVRIHRNCLVAADQLAELRRDIDGQVRAELRDTDTTLEVSRRCLPALRARMKNWH